MRASGIYGYGRKLRNCLGHSWQDTFLTSWCMWKWKITRRGPSNSSWPEMGDSTEHIPMRRHAVGVLAVLRVFLRQYVTSLLFETAASRSFRRCKFICHIVWPFTPSCKKLRSALHIGWGSNKQQATSWLSWSFKAWSRLCCLSAILSNWSPRTPDDDVGWYPPYSFTRTMMRRSPRQNSESSSQTSKATAGSNHIQVVDYPRSPPSRTQPHSKYWVSITCKTSGTNGPDNC